MLLRLNLPYIDRSVEAATVVRWYKTEGERVDYGDDLVDLEVRMVGRLRRSLSLRDLSRLTRQRIAERSKVTYEDVPDRWLRVRITSSDMGFLCRIEALEGVSRKVGEMLALLTTEENEPFDYNLGIAEKTSSFRVIATKIVT